MALTLWLLSLLGLTAEVHGFLFLPIENRLQYPSAVRHVSSAMTGNKMASTTDGAMVSTSSNETNSFLEGYQVESLKSSLPEINDDMPVSKNSEEETSQADLYKLQGKLLKNLRQVCKDYDMLQDGDHVMVCVSGGKDSACLLYLLLLLQKQLKQQKQAQFLITAVHVDQHQPGYDGTTLVQWLDKDLDVPYHVVSEDTYSIVIDKTAPNKSYCTVCSRLRRGILYTTAKKLGCNKIALGHHADDAMETLLLNMIYAGQIKSMPARYTSSRHSLGVLRPLMACFEDDLQRYATMQGFPILPCNLCSNQANLQRPQMKLFLSTLQATCNTNVKQNILHSMKDIRPSHLLDQNLRELCGMDPVTGETRKESSPLGVEEGLGDNDGDASYNIKFLESMHTHSHDEDNDDDPI